ncbi:hypothetical protein E3O53_10175 [Cryobacterium sp. TMT2-18-3]|uniref:hypothetical protein n=1 Tax=unclassified Cryobacterium TaxID=2649013 RepID=UPI00106AC227|nr:MULTISPECIES: hypothetical protein [unclassified Cryobacterium]TFC30280.1 hypothetical protein E3O22_04410 [Cryobacterium sp. TMT2-18-2]TFC35119.1 hypothetical protein E3O18_10520 [Cryobacterium sp. TMT2-42-4]TFC63586.1 hypothetical protein E3O53_10175 [Cryobacterium sp. TMT2-18-3]
MFVHPLARTDQHLIQDFMLTKIALLLARHAEREEWVFEMRAMDEKAREGSSGGPAFLFVYTVARYYIAVTCTQSEAPVDTGSFGKPRPTFVDDFTGAVAANDSQRALSLWMTSPFSLETSVAASATQQLAFGFIDRLTVPETELIASNVADFLPDPFIPVSVGNDKPEH